MNKREIASLACKILGIYLIIQGINAMANVFAVSTTTPNQMSSGSLFNIIFPYTFWIIFGILLWLFSDKISLLMFRGELFTHDNLGIKANDLQRIVFSALGLFFIGNSLPKLVTNLTNIYTMREVTNTIIRLLPGILGAITQLAIGVGIFLGSQGLVNLLYRLRNVGLSKEEDNREDE